LTAARATPKQSLEESAMVRGSALFLLFFYFNAGANKLVNLMAGLKVTLGELVINVVAWISVPNETCDFYEKLTVCSELGIAPFQQREGSAANARVLRTEQLIHM
jgi:hypothetical protein